MNRGDRLYPYWSSPSYCVLTEIRKTLIKIIEDYVIPINKKSEKNVVDLGCGGKPYSPLFESYVEQYIGVDFFENELADLHFAPGTVKVDLPDNTAKVIVSTQVLEHIPDPKEYLLEARRLLDPDGIMILSTHGYWHEHPDPNDYWRWTSEGLLKLMNDNHWEVAELIGILGFAAAALQLLQNALKMKFPNILREAFIVCMQLCICCIDRFYTSKGKLRDASVFVVVAKPIKK